MVVEFLEVVLGGFRSFHVLVTTDLGERFFYSCSGSAALLLLLHNNKEI